MATHHRNGARGRRLAVVLLPALLGTAAACVSLTGLTGGQDGGAPDAACVSNDTCLQLPDAGAGRVDRTSSTTHDGDAGHDAQHPSGRVDGATDAARDVAHDTSDAPACVPVMTTVVSLGDGGSCPVPPDASCYPQPVPPSQLAWVPPHPHEAACTETELASIGSTSNPTLSNRCRACFFATTNETQYGAEVDFPQVTFVGYGFANVAGCVATLEPCNQPCALLLEQVDLCSSEACLPSCKPSDQASYNATVGCVQSAEQNCPCGDLAAAANECLNAIILRGSPAAACLPNTTPGESEQQAYYTQLEAVTQTLCGGYDAGDGG